MKNLIIPTINGDQDKIRMFRDWFNNFLTLSRFASYYDITENEALSIIDQGRKLHDDLAYKIQSGLQVGGAA